MNYKNPIISGFNPDPSVCRVGEDYYLVTSSFEFFPGVPIYHSKDLINWEHIGYCLTRKSQLFLDGCECSHGIYAATIRHNNGIFYMCTTNVTIGKNIIVTATDPAGEWSEPIYVDLPGIDPTLFFDDDGRVYFATNGGKESGKSKDFGLIIVEIDINTGKLLSDIKLLWEGTGGRYLEAPHIYKINGMYYLIASEGGTEAGHMVTVARSKNVWGEYESYEKNPVLTHRDKPHEIQGTGHGDLVCDHKGNWWIVFLAYRTTGIPFHHLGRETFIAPVKWSEDGWFIVNDNKIIEIEMEADCLPTYKFEKCKIRDDFDKDKLDLCWNFLRNPDEKCYSLTDRKSMLKLIGNELTLNDLLSPTFIGRRQQHFNCNVQTLMEFVPQNDKQEAGLTVFHNNELHYEIAVTLINGERYIIARQTIGDISAIVAREKIQSDNIKLSIVAERDFYSFGYCEDENDDMLYMAMGRTQYVSSEVARCSFTGVYIGLYATGDESVAYFDWFDYKINE